ncbi:MAG: hypothetical protein FJ317_00395 [SAR202 cluster bacterium]|nr:hypothetical protein [SAR202 cluster bacterium]
MALATERSLPRHVQFVWHGANNRANLRQFLASNIQWAEVDVRLDPSAGQLVLRHDPLGEPSAGSDSVPMLLEEAVEATRFFGKSLKLDLKEGGRTLDRIVETLASRGVDSSRLWFNGNVEVLREPGFRRLSRIFPGAVIQCPIDFAADMVLNQPDQARELLKTLRGWGINRFSVNWATPGKQRLLDRLDRWGYAMNIYNVPDLESFLRAVLLLPKSITSDFNFPQWHYFGMGSGEAGRHHHYALAKAAS